MNRQEFMKQLEELLADVPENEKKEALEYYENYFEDAGIEQEAAIIEELQSPQAVASSIKKDLFGENYQAYSYFQQNGAQNQNQGAKKDNLGRNILIGVLLVITFPVWVGIAGGLFGILIGAVAAVFGIAVAFVAVVGALLISGSIMIGLGIIKSFAGLPAVGILVIGIGLLFLALGILGVIALVWIIGAFLPWMIRGIINLCRRAFRKKEAAV